MLGKLIMLIIAGALLFQPMSASAYDSSWPKASDMPFLPPYCKVRFDNDKKSPQYKAWQQRFGEGFHHIHHYCAGLLFLKRANETFGNKGDEKNLLIQALNNFNYVTKHAPQDFVLNPVILVQSGGISVRLGRPSEALTDFNRAIELNPNYTPAYGALADFYKDSGDMKKARDIIDAGLKKAPNSKALKRRLNELKSPH